MGKQPDTSVTVSESRQTGEQADHDAEPADGVARTVGHNEGADDREGGDEKRSEQLPAVGAQEAWRLVGSGQQREQCPEHGQCDAQQAKAPREPGGGSASHAGLGRARSTRPITVVPSPGQLSTCTRPPTAASRSARF